MRRFGSLLLALALVLGLCAPAGAVEDVPYSADAETYENTGYGYVKPPEGPYWKYLTLEEGANLVATAKAPGNPPFLIAYVNNPGLYDNDFSSVFTMAEYARERGQLVYCVDLNQWGRLACAADTGLRDYLSGAATPIFFWYGGDPENIILVDAWMGKEDPDYGVVTMENEEMVETIFALADAGVGFRSAVGDLAVPPDLTGGAVRPTTTPQPSGTQPPATQSRLRFPPQAMSAAAPVGEAPSPWAGEAVDGARAVSLIPKALDGSYTKPVTRAEFCALVCTYAAAVGLEPGTEVASFPDCSDPLVLAAAGLGVINGYADGTFGPENPVRRDEAAAMLSRLARRSGLAPNLPASGGFSDVAGGWAAEPVAFVSACLDPGSGTVLMGGTGGGSFSPGGSYTREQAIVTFYRLLTAWNLRDVAVVDAAQPLALYPGVTACVRDGALAVTGCLRPQVDGVYSYQGIGEADLSALAPGVYTAELWEELGEGESVHREGDDLTLIKTASGAYYFRSSSVYAVNQAWYDELTAPAAGEYLDESYFISPGDPAIQARAKAITAGCASDYDKLKAIADWVSANISYDFDAYGSGDGGALRAPEVLERGEAVCEGYANLTAALCRAAGVPAQKVSGYALGYGAVDSWDEYDFYSGETNHAWNLAWADGRWVTLDTTWDIFDPSVWHFSEDHYWMEEDTDPSWTSELE